MKFSPMFIPKAENKRTERPWLKDVPEVACTITYNGEIAKGRCQIYNSVVYGVFDNVDPLDEIVREFICPEGYEGLTIEK